MQSQQIEPHTASSTAHHFADSRIMQEMAHLLPLFEEDIASLHEHEQFAWVAPLSRDERLQLRNEFARSFMSALLTGDWTEYEDVRDGWRATADVLRDPELTAALVSN